MNIEKSQNPDSEVNKAGNADSRLSADNPNLPENPEDYEETLKEHIEGLNQAEEERANSFASIYARLKAVGASRSAKKATLDKIDRFATNATLLFVTTITIYLAHAMKKEYEYLWNESSIKKKLGFESTADHGEYEKLREWLVSKVGRRNVYRMEVGQINQSGVFFEKSSEQENFFKGEEYLNPEVCSFLKKIINTKDPVIPKTWLKEISEIKFCDEEKTMSHAYGLKIESTSEAGHVDTEGWTVHVFTGNQSMIDERNQAINFMEVIFHEISHCNDWIRDSKMSVKQRALLLRTMIDRVESSDRYQSPYVEDIDSPRGKEETLFLKASEYFAECCRVYFFSPESFRNKNPIDFEIIDRYVKTKQPDFDPVKNKDRIVEIINQSFSEVVKAPDLENYIYDYTYGEYYYTPTYDKTDSNADKSIYVSPETSYSYDYDTLPNPETSKKKIDLDKKESPDKKKK